MAEKTRWDEITDIWRNNTAVALTLGLIVGLVLGLILGLAYHNELDGWFIDGFWTEALGIALTVGVLDRLNSYRLREQQKERLIWQANSKSNTTAIDAIDELRSEGWLCGDDGLLQDQDMKHARLMNARLKNANLQGTDLFKASFIHAHMTGVNLRDCQLKGALFCHARLIGADFTGANVRDTNFTLATFDKNTILPDGTPYDNSKGHEQWEAFGAIVDDDVPIS